MTNEAQRREASDSTDLLAAIDQLRQRLGEEEFNRLLESSLKDARIKWTEYQNGECSAGRHGFNLQTWVDQGGIHSRCLNCGKFWTTPDVPFM